MEENVRAHYSVWSPITSGRIWNFYYRGWGFLLQSCINKFDNQKNNNKLIAVTYDFPVLCGFIALLRGMADLERPSTLVSAIEECLLSSEIYSSAWKPTSHPELAFCLSHLL